MKNVLLVYIKTQNTIVRFQKCSLKNALHYRNNNQLFF